MRILRGAALVAVMAGHMAAPVLAQTAMQGGGLTVFPVKLLDTSYEAQDQTAEHGRRQALLAEALAADLSGQLLAQADLDAACPHQTTQCLMDLLRDRGADRGLFIVVQKSSTLILQVFATVVDVGAARAAQHSELSFRGDNDEAWRRAGQFLARQLRAGR